MSLLTLRDGAQLHYKDWGQGPPVLLSHGWPLNADSWEAQMLSLAEAGFRCIAHDRRGHGRSSQPWDGNDMDGFADDLAELIVHLDLHDATLIGFSMGGGEVARYVGRHGTRRLSKVALIAAVTPLMLKTAANPSGLPLDAFDKIRAACRTDRAQFYRDLASGPFYGANRPGAKVSPGTIDAFCSQGMQASHRSTYECIEAFSATDFSADLARIDLPTLIVHGADDQIVPIHASAHHAALLIKGAELKVYDDAPHGLTVTHRERLDVDLRAFLQS